MRVGGQTLAHTNTHIHMGIGDGWLRKLPVAVIFELSPVEMIVLVKF